MKLFDNHYLYGLTYIMPITVPIKNQTLRNLISSHLNCNSSADLAKIIDKTTIPVPIYDYQILMEADYKYRKTKDTFYYWYQVDDDWEENLEARYSYDDMCDSETLILTILKKTINTYNLEDDLINDYYFVTECFLNGWKLNTERYLDFSINLLNYLLECESPIERKYLLNLLLVALVEDLGFIIENRKLGKCKFINRQPLVTVELQKYIDLYRVDFFVTLQRGTELSLSWENTRNQICRLEEIQSVIVECQGKDTHYGNTEQINKTNSRLIDLQRQFHVLPFTGSQINKKPLDCARESIKFLFEKMEGDSYRLLETPKKYPSQKVVNNSIH